MNTQVERSGIGVITPLDVAASVRPGTFEKMRDRGYTRVALGRGDWVYDKIPLLVRLAGGQAYRITEMWAFFHPDGSIAAAEKPKTRIFHSNHDQQNTPLSPQERTFGFWGRFGARREYESYLEAYKIQAGEPFDLQEFMASEVYQLVLNEWRLTRHVGIHKVDRLLGRWGPKILRDEILPPQAGMPVDHRGDVVLSRIEGYGSEDPAIVRFARVIDRGKVIIGECRDEIHDDYLREINDWEINKDPEIRGQLRFVMS